MAKSLVDVTDPSSSLEFFKVFLPSSSSHHMSIPSAFVKYFNGAIPSEAVLRDEGGKSWDVTMEKLNNKVFFKNGWQEFVDSHCLKQADFLVFQFDGSHMFDVKIFSKNGCSKKLVSGTGSPFPEAKVKNEPQPAQDYSTSLTRFKRNYPEVRSSDSSGTAPKLRRRATNLFELSPSKTANAVAMESLTFEHVVKHWSHIAIHIPKLVVAAHNISMKPSVVIIDEMGRSWLVTTRPRSHCRFSLTTGWSSFFQANSLKVADICTFQFILDSDNSCSKLHVKITRK